MSRDRAHKTASKTPPRRSSQRIAKTIALSAFSNNNANTIPKDNINNKNNKRKKKSTKMSPPPNKKPWKTERRRQAQAQQQIQQQSGVPVEVTPQQQSLEIVSDLPAAIQGGNQTTRNNNNNNNNNKPDIDDRTKIRILARINLDGAFRLFDQQHERADDPIRGNSNKSSMASWIRAAGVKRLKVVTKYSKDKDPFPIKLFQMMESATSEYPTVCRWSDDGRCIEIDAKNPTLLLILKQHFNHSKWLSFSRQLNNYGFQSVVPRPKRLKTYKHPNFFRSVRDPNTLVGLLPYLPGLRRRMKKEVSPNVVAVAAANTRTKKRRGSVASKSPWGGASLAVNTVTPLTTTSSSSSSSTKSNSLGLPLSDTVAIRGTKTPKKRPANRSKTRGITEIPTRAIKKPKRSRRTDGGALQITPTTASEATSDRTTTESIQSSRQLRVGGEKEQKAGSGFMKTPSPYNRNAKENYMSSPPPLSHYLYPKNRSIGTDIGTSTTNTGSNSSNCAATGKHSFSSSNESPLFSSLLTVNFIMSPSCSLSQNNEQTPRTSNLSSSQSSPSSSQDGFRMLSWAARAVESPPPAELPHHFSSRNTRTGSSTSTTSIATTPTPNGNKKAGFLRTMCSPIVPRNNKHSNNNKSSPLLSIHNNKSGPHESERRISTTSASPAIRSHSTTGPSPLSFRGGHHQDSELELELLRNCLEDVFVATSGSNNGVTADAADAGSSSATAAINANSKTVPNCALITNTASV